MFGRNFWAKWYIKKSSRRSADNTAPALSTHRSLVEVRFMAALSLHAICRRLKTALFLGEIGLSTTKGANQ